MQLKEPYGLVLLSLAKPSSNVPFIMPKRIAETPSSEQISEYVGSGPFVFERDEWEPGNKAVFTKFEGYKPRSEPPSWAAGGKVAKVDRVEWVWIPDMQTAVNALINGEIDVIKSPSHDLLPILEADESIELFDYNPLGNQYMFRMNWLHPPFDNQKVRQAALAALNQEDFLKAVIGDPRYYKTCPAMFICDTPFATDVGGEVLMTSDFERSKQLLEEAGYDGTPVVLMHSTDLGVLANLAPVAKQLLEQGGFTVDMQSMDWQTLVSRRAKKEPPAEGGWNAFLTNWVAADVLNPISTAGLNASCEDAWFGWPCDEQLEQLRLAFATETDPAKQTELAHQIQARALEVGTHAYVGQWYQPIAHREQRVGPPARPGAVLLERQQERVRPGGRRHDRRRASGEPAVPIADGGSVSLAQPLETIARRKIGERDQGASLRKRPDHAGVLSPRKNGFLEQRADIPRLRHCPLATTAGPREASLKGAR